MPGTTAAIGGRYAKQATNTRERRPEHYRSGANRAPFPELGETSRMNDTNRLLRLAEVQEITGLGKTTIYRYVRLGELIPVPGARWCARCRVARLQAKRMDDVARAETGSFTAADRRLVADVAAALEAGTGAVVLAIANAANFSVPPGMDADAAHASMCEWLADARVVCKSRNNNRLHRAHLPAYHFQYVQWIPAEAMAVALSSAR